jgi:hypothetical protein
MQSFFAEIYLLFEFLGFSGESCLVFGVDDFICPLYASGSRLIFSAWERTAGTTERT